MHTLLVNKYYFDWFNENVLARASRGLGTVWFRHTKFTEIWNSPFTSPIHFPLPLFFYTLGKLSKYDPIVSFVYVP
jgi:hypothetical protein